MIDARTYPQLASLVAMLSEQWPEHAPYLAKSFAGRDTSNMEIAEEVAIIIGKLSVGIKGGIEALCADYRFLCEDIVLPEELYFRRNCSYRLTRFEDANRECYANAEFMGRYMNGLLMSNAMWANHTAAMTHFVRTYLPTLKDGSAHLEIGPGHGIFLYFAASRAAVSSVSAWDVSPTSIVNTRHALATLGVTQPVSLVLQNLFHAQGADAEGNFDSIVMSEILEHLENPVEALRAAAVWLKPSGQIWVNVPANSPAPDHIYLFTSPEHLCDVVRSAGLEVVTSDAFAMQGVSLAKAAKNQLSVSCVVTARKRTRRAAPPSQGM
jgi:2-polyprenyl-3-methyl-5-hydroxy-6-metoxy-1,4-benzoquinol methylase